MSKKLESFEEAFDILNEKYFENLLSKSIITVYPTPGAHGHFTCSKVWEDGQERYHEINLAAADVARPLEEVMATLVHEMVHQWCAEQEIQDTSRGNTYHNKRFRDAAISRGLLIEHHATYGWSRTLPADSLKSLVASGVFAAVEAQLHRLGSAQKGGGSGKDASAKKKWHTYICPQCEKWVRAREEMELRCCECECDMEEKDD